MPKNGGMTRSAALTMIIKTVVGGKKVINAPEDSSDSVSSDLLSHALVFRGAGACPRLAASRIAELCFFCIFSPARQAALLKFWALVALFSGPEGLAAKRRSPYLDN